MRVRPRFTAVLAAICLSVTVGVMAPAAPASSVPAALGTFTAGGSINQVYTYGHAAGTALDLLDSSNAVVQSGVADAQGAKLFKDVAKGTGYKVRAGGAGGDTSADLTVTNPEDNPDQSFYKGITLNEGFGYLPTRDGTLLSVNVIFPKDGSKPPWPVVMDYSGYDPSQAGTTPQEAAFYPYRGYVVVGVNMRGTTCSGGAFDFFEPPQSTDGYDAVEALGNQAWSNGNVGLVGISYSGYSQLYVAATQPPHLRAITPLSPYADTYRSILYPGGILNNGFALGWAADRQEASKPQAHQWVRDRINGGDTTCKANQVMRLQSRDLLAEIRPGRFDERPLGDYLDTTTFAGKITVPVYLAAQFQDEQTGGHSAELATIFEKNPKSKAVFTNGTHIEPLGPTELPRVLEFVDFYVGHKIPSLGGSLRVGVPEALRGLFGDPINNLPFDRFTSYPDYDSALAAYEAEPPVRIRWENGGKKGYEGSPYSVYDTSYPAWPIPSVTAQRWYLQPDGQLAQTAPTVADDEARGASSYLYDPTTKRHTSFDGSTDDAWRTHPDIHWLPLTEGNSLSFTTPAYTAKTAYAGTGSVDLWVQSTAVDTDFEVTLTEVRPDGHEQAIQSGWLRASHRKTDPAKSTELRPYQSHTEPDSAPLPAGQLVPARIELFPFAHIVSPGSKLRLNIEAPGGNQPFWAFDDLPGGATNTIGHSVGHPSSVALPMLPTDPTLNYWTSFATPNPCVVPGVTTQAQSYRNQPCRQYHPARVPTAVTAAKAGAGATVSWTPPAPWADGTGGAPTGFLVTAQPGGATEEAGGGATSVTFPTLPPGASYTFTVKAVFATGTAPASDASLSLLIPGVITTTTTTTTQPTTTTTTTTQPTTTTTTDGGGTGSTSTSTTTTTLPAGSGGTGTTAPVRTDAERFVHAAYLDLLGRPVDPSALQFWLGQLAGGMSRTKVALHLVNSDEYRRLVVKAEYRTILGRTPSAAELTNGVATLRADPSVDDFRAGLIGSNEFWTKAGATPAGFAKRLYQVELGRSPDAFSRAYILAKLADGTTTTQVGAWLVRTNEADVHLVRAWYQRYLGRPASAAEAGFWATRMRTGRTESSITAEVVGSDEYLAQA